MNIITLKEACLYKITKEIWYGKCLTADLVECVHKNAETKAAKNKMSQASKDYKALVESVIKEIMAEIPLAEPLKIKIALSFIDLNKDMNNWAEALNEMLYKPTKANLHYCMYKTFLGPNCKVERNRSVLKIMFDSYLRCCLHYFTVSMYCHITLQSFNNFVKGEPYLRDKKFIEKVKNEVRMLDPFRNWLVRLRSEHRYLLRVSKMLLMIETAKSSPIEIWEYILKRIEHEADEHLCLCLTHVLMSDNYSAEKIIFVSEKVEEEVWAAYLQRYWVGIMFNSLFLSNHTDFFFKFFEIGCRHLKTDDYFDTLLQILGKMSLSVYGYGGDYIYYMRCKEIFMKVWYRVPIEVKKEIGEEKSPNLDIQELLAMCTAKDHYHLYSIILNELCTPEKIEKYLCNTIFNYVITNQEKKISKLLQEFEPKITLETIKRDISGKLKSYLRDNILENNKKLMHFTFKNKKEINKFKEELFKDKGFVIDHFAVLAMSCEKEDVNDLLMWAFNKDKKAKEQFINKKLIGENWIVDIYKKYLTYNSRYGSWYASRTVLLDCLVTDPTEKSRIKALLRQDKEFLFKCFDKSIEEVYSEITAFMPCLFDETDKAGRKTLALQYLTSEQGKNHLFDMVSACSVQNKFLYCVHKIERYVRDVYNFKKHWIKPYDIATEVLDLFTNITADDLVDRKEKTKRVMLPHESEEQHRVIVNINLRMFHMIVGKDIDKDILLFKLKDSAKSYLTRRFHYF